MHRKQYVQKHVNLNTRELLVSQAHSQIVIGRLLSGSRPKMHPYLKGHYSAFHPARPFLVSRTQTVSTVHHRTVVHVFEVATLQQKNFSTLIMRNSKGE